MRRARIPARALAIVVAAPFAVAPAGMAGADVCGFYGPGFGGPGYCGPPYNNIGGEVSQSDSSWPPGFNYVSGSAGGTTPATPIVPVASGP
jgi:hypothetical protein